MAHEPGRAHCSGTAHVPVCPTALVLASGKVCPQDACGPDHLITAGGKCDQGPGEGAERCAAPENPQQLSRVWGPCWSCWPHCSWHRNPMGCRVPDRHQRCAESITVHIPLPLQRVKAPAAPGQTTLRKASLAVSVEQESVTPPPPSGWKLLRCAHQSQNRAVKLIRALELQRAPRGGLQHQHLLQRSTSWLSQSILCSLPPLSQAQESYNLSLRKKNYPKQPCPPTSPIYNL